MSIFYIFQLVLVDAFSPVEQWTGGIIAELYGTYRMRVEKDISVSIIFAAASAN